MCDTLLLAVRTCILSKFKNIAVMEMQLLFHDVKTNKSFILMRCFQKAPAPVDGQQSALPSVRGASCHSFQIQMNALTEASRRHVNGFGSGDESGKKPPSPAGTLKMSEVTHLELSTFFFPLCLSLSIDFPAALSLMVYMWL